QGNDMSPTSPANRRRHVWGGATVVFLTAVMCSTVALWGNPPVGEGPGGSVRIRGLGEPSQPGGPPFEARFLVNNPAEGPLFRLAAASGKPQVDPIEANGRIFVDWPKPDVALVFTGEQMGFLEPCGCAGLENQKGGYMRRFTMLKQLRDQ